LKVVLIGNICVGKTALLFRYIQNEQPPIHLATVGVEFATTTVQL